MEVQDNHGYLKGKYCGSQIPSSITSYGSIRVRFLSDSFGTYSGFMAFYQTGYSLPTTATYPNFNWTYPNSRPHTLYWTTKTSSGRQDTFKATVSSKKGTTQWFSVCGNVYENCTVNREFYFFLGTRVNIAGIVVPLVVAVFLFSIIFVVLKCTTIRRSIGPAGPSCVNDVPLQPLRVEIPPTTQTLSASSAAPQSSPPNTDLVPLYNPESFATFSDPPPTYTDYSQGVTNLALGDRTAQE